MRFPFCCWFRVGCRGHYSAQLHEHAPSAQKSNSETSAAFGGKSRYCALHFVANVGSDIEGASAQLHEHTPTAQKNNSKTFAAFGKRYRYCVFRFAAGFGSNVNGASAQLHERSRASTRPRRRKAIARLSPLLKESVAIAFSVGAAGFGLVAWGAHPNRQ